MIDPPLVAGHPANHVPPQCLEASYQFHDIYLPKKITIYKKKKIGLKNV